MSLQPHYPILTIIVPLFGSFLILLFGRAEKTGGWLIATASTALSFMLSVWLLTVVVKTGSITYWLGGWEPPWGIEYVIDYLSGFVLVIVSFMAFIVSLFSRNSVQVDIPDRKRRFFYALYLLLFMGLMGIVITGDIFNLYVFLEISALSGYTLIAMGKNREALKASYNYLILGTIAATFILLGIGYLYMATGSLNMADLRERLIGLYHSKVVLTAFAFFTVGLSIKLALFPFHVWLPNSYTYAPSVVSAFLAATATKVGAYALIRVMFTVFTPAFDIQVVPVTKLLLVLAATAMIAGPLLAIAQTDVRRMLAYSSVGQIGYIVLGFSLMNEAGLIGSLIHLFNHALMKGGLFLVVGAVIYKTGITHISELRGLAKTMPATMAAFLVGALSMVGVPLTVGFVSKWYLAIAALQAGRGFLIPVIILSSLLTAVYFWRIIENAYFRGEGEGLRPPGRGEAPATMMIPIWTAAALCLVFGVFAFVPVTVAELGARLLLGVE